MNNLYMIGIGGKTDESNIEVHDIQFLVGDSIETTHSSLRKNWYGTDKSLHMDSYLTLKGVEGYEIIVKEEENVSGESLYCVTFGGYQADVFQEIHCYEMVVATFDKEAKSIALNQVKSNLKNLHVDNVVEISRALTGSLYDLHFEKSNELFKVLPEWQGYTKLCK